MRRTPEDRYRANIQKQQRTLEDFAASEIEWADDLLLWYRIRKEDIPGEQYRAAAFFKNREYLRKPGSLSFLYGVYTRCVEELPECTPEIAFDLLDYRYKMYAQCLEKGGYND